MNTLAKTPTSNFLLCSAMALSGLTGCDDLGAEDQSRLSAETIEILDNLDASGMPDSEVEVREDGSVLVGGDALVTVAASREMAGARAVLSDDGTDFRHYATTNLIGASVQLICLVEVAPYTGTMSAGLDSAIDRYNQLDLSFELQRGNGANCDATINMRTQSGTGALAGFPSNGLPYENIWIGTGVPNSGLDATRHVIMHEIGHTVGFRHSDYYDRGVSCPAGLGGSERVDPEGANEIGGTPTTATYGGSVMNACYNRGSDGEWTLGDLNALSVMFGDGTVNNHGEDLTGPDSCVGSCGANAGACWCDDMCEFFGDCCLDRVEVCEQGGTGTVSATAPSHFEENSFCDLYHERTISLGTAHDGRFVSSQDLASGGALTQATTVGTHEQFVVKCLSGTKIALETSNGQFLQALGSSAPSNIGRRDFSPTAGRIVWVPELQTDGSWAFRSWDGLRMRARPSGANYVVDVFSGSAGGWKRFDVTLE